MRIRLFILLALFIGSVSYVEAAELLAGPMVGHTTATSAKIWIETDRAAAVRIEYWIEPRLQDDHTFGETIVRGYADGHTGVTAPHTGVVELTNLKPGWLVYYEIHIDGRPIRALTPQAFSLMPPVVPEPNRPDEIVEFIVAFGSCMYPARIPIQPIWGQIAKHHPAAFLFIGDNNYMPNHAGAYATSRETVRYIMARYHRSLRNMPGVRTLIATVPSYGIWDDHDFGPNNSDRTFRWRDESLAMFRRYWPNASAGTPKTPGIFHAFKIADVEFFMLDNRYHRDPNLAQDRRTMFGSDQLTWLKAGLKASTATFKVIANGGTLLVEGTMETWHRFGVERDDFLKWVFEENITGVLFIAGDWHVGTVNRLHRPRDAYPLYELISSNAAVRAVPVEQMATPRSGGHHQSAAPIISDYNFGALRFSGTRGKRVVTLQIIDDQGKVRIHRRLTEKDLGPAWAKQ